jgi:hypothetical protein
MLLETDRKRNHTLGYAESTNLTGLIPYDYSLLTVLY